MVWDPDAVIDFEAVKSKGDRKAVFTVVDKLRRLGSDLVPPHVKSLKGQPGLYELRPRQGSSAVRPLYGRFGARYVILAVARKTDFDKKVKEAAKRAGNYPSSPSR